MTIEELIAQLRASMATNLATRVEQRQIIIDVQGTCAADNDRDPNAEEAARISAAQGEIARLDSQREPVMARIAQLEADHAADEAARAQAREVNGPEGQQERQHAPARVTGEQRTYTRDSNRSGVSIFADMWNAQRGSFAARQRLERHMNEVEAEGQGVERASSTSSFPGLIVPQYLVDMYEPIARAGRPVANICTHHDLPAEGMTLSIPRGNVGTVVNSQNGQNTAVTLTDTSSTELIVPVRTIAGGSTTSRQVLERGGNSDDLIYADLIAAYNAELDRQILVGTGANEQHKGVLNAAVVSVTWTTGTPDFPGVWKKLADANQQVESVRFISPTVVVFHSRRWGWLIAQLDAGGRPLMVIQAVGPHNGVAINDAAQYGGIRGELANGQVAITDGNVPTNLGTGTNEDRIFSLSPRDLHLWEESGPPRLLRFEQTAGRNLSVDLIAYGYSAFTAERFPNSHAVISGTGLVAPTF